MYGVSDSGCISFIKQAKKDKAIAETGREGPLGCETSRLSHFLWIIGPQTAVRLPALSAGCLLSPKKIPGTHFC
jgi:hypothetical protein